MLYPMFLSASLFVRVACDFTKQLLNLTLVFQIHIFYIWGLSRKIIKPLRFEVYVGP